ncbi:chemotaxis protein CheW [Bacteroidota bacterium]
MGEPYQLIVFVLDEKKFSLHLENIDRVIQAVEIIGLPNAPEIILGVINIHGEIVPIINIRKKFNLTYRELSIHDKMIIVKTKTRKFGFIVDHIDGYFESTPHAVIKGESVWPGLEYVDEVVKLSDEMVLINNPENFFLKREEKDFKKAIKKSSK